MNKLIDLTGQAFSRLTVVSRTESGRSGARWDCICDCGAAAVVSACNLKSGKSQSCGCLHRKRVTTHGNSGMPAYNAWREMIRRCTDPSAINWPSYGGRGIKVSEAWLRFGTFYADMGARPFASASIDRIENGLGYAAGNCRWADAAKQSRNMRTNVYLTHNGQTMILTDWAGAVGLNENTLRMRLKRGLSVADALTQPTQVHKSRGQKAGKVAQL